MFLFMTMGQMIIQIDSFRSKGDMHANLLNSDMKAEEQNNTCCAPTLESCNIS